MTRQSFDYMLDDTDWDLIAYEHGYQHGLDGYSILDDEMYFSSDLDAWAYQQGQDDAAYDLEIGNA